MIRAQFPDLFVNRLAYLDTVMFEEFEAPDTTYTQVFDVRDSSRGYEEMTGVTGFDQFGQRDESAPTEYDVLLQEFDKRLTHVTWAKGFQVSMEASEDDLDRIVSDAGPALARAAKNTIETDAYGDFINGFSSVTTPDGLSLFNTAHILRGGGTFSNRINGDLAQITLEQAVNLFDDMRDGRNQLIKASPKTLMYPPELRWLVTELLQSQLRSDTADNATNALTQLGLAPLMVPYLTSATDWYLLSDPSRHKLVYWWRREPVVDHAIDFDTDTMKTKMSFRNSHGPYDWRNLVGGDGT